MKLNFAEIRCFVFNFLNIFIRLLLLMFFLFLISLPYFGMLISGILFVFITQTLIGSRDKRSLILHAIVSVGAVGGMWAIFRFGLGVVMPAGSLF